MTAEEYRNLIKEFTDSKMTASEFESLYLETFKSDTTHFPKELFLILDRMFSGVDAYDPECSPEEETTFRISEEGLRKEARQAVERLDGYILKKGEKEG